MEFLVGQISEILGRLADLSLKSSVVSQQEVFHERFVKHGTVSGI